MLKKNPKERITAAEAYQDPWIQNNSFNQPFKTEVL